MIHSDVYRKFETMFPEYAETNDITYFSNGRNSIRIRSKNRGEYVFTFNGADDWRFETVKSFMERRK